MSKKRMMSKQQRLYYEYSRKEKVEEELIELSRNVREYEQKVTTSSFDPHKTSYYN
jgi:hypothetical protein